ncbi:MAG: VanZ family protein [Lachnospiraceae bacterium]|nr:VanZ family protein [Lachnospiraceae bacterium]
MEKTRRITAILFIIYILYLIWAVLFKFSFSYAEIPYKRQYINWNLFYNPNSYLWSPVIIREKIMNVLIFLPFGAYLYMLGARRFISSFLIMLFTSILFEIIQYVFVLGTSDVTDVAANTIGGVTGYVLAYLTLMISKKEEKMTRHFTILSAVFTVVVISGTLLLKIGYLG